MIPGVERKERVDENWRIFKGSSDLNEKGWKEIEVIRTEHGKSFCRRCDYCRSCPEEIPISFALGFRDIAKRSGLGTLRRNPFHEAVVRVEPCSESGECVTRCPYGLPIPELIQDTLRWLKTQPG